MIISKKTLSGLIFSLKTDQIKKIINRRRLKFTYGEMVLYVHTVFIHSQKCIHFKHIYEKYKSKGRIDINYSTFMNNVTLFSPLVEHLFNSINQNLLIKPSVFVNIVDTSLIPMKQEKYITKKDWKNNNVTTRSSTSYGITVKHHICGYKGLFFANRKGFIYHVSMLNINYSDQNILKDSAMYIRQLKGLLLADRGFNNKVAKQRVSTITGNTCRLITPAHYTQVKKTGYYFNSIKEQKIYRKRWKIETIFKNIKSRYNSFKLDLTGVKSIKLKKAKFFVSVILWNLNLLSKS